MTAGGTLVRNLPAVTAVRRAQQSAEHRRICGQRHWAVASRSPERAERPPAWCRASSPGQMSVGRPEPARHECSGGSRPLLLLGTREMVLAITVLGTGIAAHDATVVSIALPTIGRDFLTSLAARQ